MTHEQFQEAVLTRLDSIDSRLERLENRMDRIETRQDSLESSVRALREDQNAIRVVLVRHLADQQSLAERVAKLEESS